jgi:hypothetical protein
MTSQRAESNPHSDNRENHKPHTIRTIFKNGYAGALSTVLGTFPSPIALCWVIWKYKCAAFHTYKTNDCLTSAFHVVSYIPMHTEGRGEMI